jgi:hypothetical protein
LPADVDDVDALERHPVVEAEERAHGVERRRRDGVVAGTGVVGTVGATGELVVPLAQADLRGDVPAGVGHADLLDDHAVGNDAVARPSRRAARR